MTSSELENQSELICNSGRNENKDDIFRYMEYLWNQINQGRSVSDLWFRYSLLVTAVPIAAVVALTKVVGENTPSDLVLGTGAVTSALLVVIGVMFSLIFTRMRINSLVLYKKLYEVEKQYLKHISCERFHDIYIQRKGKRVFTSGAEYYVSLMQSILNAAWLSLFIILLVSLKGYESSILKSPMLPLLVPLIFVFLQQYVRHRILAPFESD